MSTVTDLEDLKSVLTLFDRNVENVKRNLISFKNDVDTVHRSLEENWLQSARADSRIISVHDGLLSSVSKVNEQIIKLNLHINLNRAVRNLKNVTGVSTNRDGIVLGELDATQATSYGKEPQPRTMNVLQLMGLEQLPEMTKIVEEASPIVTPLLGLLPPKGGRELSSQEAYDLVSKNMSNFTVDNIVLATVMHINILENCIFVAKWGEESTPLKQLLENKMTVKKLKQYPDFGKIFGVHDSQDNIIPRVLINAHSAGGGFDAYLLDYGEHIYLKGDEVIYELPNDVAALPAEAIRCYLSNRNVDYMREFIYKEVRLRILDNNGNDLKVELLEDEQSDEKTKNESVKSAVKQEQPAITDQEFVKPTIKLSESDMAMLENVEASTSNAVKAVLGFNPTDDKRICRHYDPKTGGCFKSSNCRLVHQLFAPHGATKDTELAEALPEINYESSATGKLYGIVRILVTHIISPTQIYVQFPDDSSPLVWSRNDLLESERKFQRDPLPLEMVLALYNDGYYYRAQVREQNNGMFTIFYVDYGNTEIVTIQSLAQCNNARSLKPFRAIRCFVLGIKRTQSDDSRKATECVEFLKSRLLNSEITVKIVRCVQDDCYIKFLEHEYNLFEELFKRGYVEPSTEN